MWFGGNFIGLKNIFDDFRISHYSHKNAEMNILHKGYDQKDL